MARTEKYVIPKLDPPEVFYWGPEIDRATARDIGLVKYFTGKPCKHGHIAERWTGCYGCCQCGFLRHTDRYRNDPKFQDYQKDLCREWWRKKRAKS